MASEAQAGFKKMLHLVDSLADQLAGSENLPGLAQVGRDAWRPRRIVLCAMGGSAIGGDLVQGLLGTQPLSVDVWRHYGLPGWVSGQDLVIAASYSGNTEEVLSAVAEARERAVPVLGISSGGRLASSLLPGEHLVRLPSGLPPRAALGHSLGALLWVLSRLGLVADLARDLPAALNLLATRPSCGRLTASELAAQIEGRLPVIYTADFLVQGVGTRWKGQLNENAKVPAFLASFPELNHNDIVGWGLPESWRDRLVLLILRSGLETDRIRRRVELTAQLLEKEFATIQILEAVGDSPLARLLSLVQYGDYVSCYLAGRRGIDPLPVHRIDRLKEGLSGL